MFVDDDFFMEKSVPRIVAPVSALAFKPAQAQA